ncbi:MAG: SRPBCC family protein [Candidatus Nanopelagicales bacterium]
MTRVIYAVDVAAPAAVVFDAVVDWRGQERWIPLTTVRGGRNEGVGVGGEVAAYTGIGGFGFLDTMTITRWEVPHRVDVLHTGAVVRGIGIMTVRPLGADRSRFYWAEELEVPLGTIGQVGWALLKPAFGLGMKAALARFAALVEAGEIGQPAPNPAGTKSPYIG